MANKRDFKKCITALVNNICQDMMLAYYNIDGADCEQIDAAIIDVLSAGEVALLKSNVKFDKTSKAFTSGKEYHTEKMRFNKSLYHHIYNEFNLAIGEALKKFNAAIPQEVKDNNKSN